MAGSTRDLLSRGGFLWVFGIILLLPPPPRTERAGLPQHHPVKPCHPELSSQDCRYEVRLGDVPDTLRRGDSCWICGMLDLLGPSEMLAFRWHRTGQALLCSALEVTEEPLDFNQLISDQAGADCPPQRSPHDPRCLIARGVPVRPDDSSGARVMYAQPGGTLVVLDTHLSGERIGIWNTSSGETWRLKTGKVGTRPFFRFSPDGSLLGYAMNDGHGLRWRYCDTLQLVGRRTVFGIRLADIAYTSDGLVVSGEDKGATELRLFQSAGGAHPTDGPGVADWNFSEVRKVSIDEDGFFFAATNFTPSGVVVVGGMHQTSLFDSNGVLLKRIMHEGEKSEYVVMFDDRRTLVTYSYATSATVRLINWDKVPLVPEPPTSSPYEWVTPSAGMHIKMQPALSPNRKLLAMPYAYGYVRIYFTLTGELIRTIAFSATSTAFVDDVTLAVCGEVCAVLDLSTPAAVPRKEGSPALRERVEKRSCAAPCLEVVQLAGGVLREISVQKGGAFVAFRLSGNNVTVWDVAAQEVVSLPGMQGEPENGIAFPPDNTRMAVAHTHSVHYFTVPDFAPPEAGVLAPDRITSSHIAFYDNARLVLCAKHYLMVETIAKNSYQEHPKKSLNDLGNLVDVSEDGSMILTSGVIPTRVFDVKDRSLASNKAISLRSRYYFGVEAKKWAVSAKFLPGSQKYAVMSNTGEVHIVSIDGDLVSEFRTGADGAVGMDVSPSGLLATSGGSDGSATVLSTQGTTLLSVQHNSTVARVAFVSDSLLLVCGRSLSCSMWVVPPFAVHAPSTHGIAVGAGAAAVAAAAICCAALLWYRLRQGEQTLQDCVGEGSIATSDTEHECATLVSADGSDRRASCVPEGGDGGVSSRGAQFFPSGRNAFSMPSCSSSGAPLSSLSTAGSSGQALSVEATRGSFSEQQMRASSRLKPLGRGSFGVVYLAALNDGSGRQVAVKEVLLGVSHSSRTRQRVEMEFTLMQSLQHTHIVQYLGHTWKSASALNIFMEYMPGGSVKSLLRRLQRGFTPGAVEVYTRQVLLGLEYLHRGEAGRAAVAHRDLKADNLLLSREGDVKISDFGCSKLFEGDGGHSAYGAQTCVGTPFWMAPEVLRKREGSAAYGTRCDIWSLGCTVVEMLGATPWRLDDTEPPHETVARIVSSTAGPPLPQDTPPDMAQFLASCFIRDPSERPSATQLLADPFMADVPDTIAVGDNPVLQFPQPPTSAVTRTLPDASHSVPSEAGCQAANTAPS